MKVKAPGGILNSGPRGRGINRTPYGSIQEASPIVWADCLVYSRGPERWQNLTNWINAGRKRLKDKLINSPLRMVVIDMPASGAEWMTTTITPRKRYSQL